jgi:hypothetical protein
MPQLWDYADNVDTIKFLLSIWFLKKIIEGVCLLSKNTIFATRKKKDIYYEKRHSSKRL